MNKKLPFEDALENKLQQLPKPSEEASWQAMSQLLDKKDHRKLLPPLKKYFIFLVLVLLLLSGLWALVRKNKADLVSQNSKTIPFKNENKKNESSYATTRSKSILIVTDDKVNKTEPGLIVRVETGKIKELDQNKNDVDSRGHIRTGDSNNNFVSEKNATGNPVDASALFIGDEKMQPGNDDNGFNNSLKKGSIVKGKQHIRIHGSLPEKGNPGETCVNGKKDILAQEKSGRYKKKFHSKGKMNMKAGGYTEEDKTDENILADLKQWKQVNSVIVNNNVTELFDDVRTKDSISANIKQVITLSVLKDSADSSTNNKTQPIAKTTLQQKKSKHLVWSAGIGLQQQIPTGKQKSTHYGFNGSKNIIGDYIPSLYLQLEKRGKWFTQLEFIYASPCMVSAFPYSRKTHVNNISKQISTTTTYLKKMYYHKVPLSFNYYLKPGWSIGAGIVYSKLYRVLSEQQLAIKNTQTQEEEMTSKIIPSGYTDSFFYKSQWSWMLQSNYQWRRFGFGIRYSMDTQPYIKYIKPTGEIEDKRKWSLELLLRFRIWESK